jgi:hypothetical protein
MDNSFKVKCGHVIRKINQDEPLKGKVLETTLDSIDYCWKGMAKTLPVIGGKSKGNPGQHVGTNRQPGR